MTSPHNRHPVSGPAHNGANLAEADSADIYFDPHELAELLGVSVQTISNWSLHGALPPRVKVGRRMMFYRSDIMEHALTWLYVVGRFAS